MLRWCAGATASTVAPAAPPPPTALPLPRAPARAARSSRRRHRLFRPCRCSARKPADEEPDDVASVLSKDKSLLLRSAVALFALGFIDAGYSGDWSRIGAISKDTEELLKLGAYAVVPLSVALIFSLSQDSSGRS